MEKVKVREIGQTLTGFAFDSNYFNNKDGFPIIRIRDLRANSTQTYFNGPFDPKYVVSKGDLLIGMDGEFNLVEWSSNDALLNQRVCKLIIDEQKADRTYIKHVLPKKLKAIEDVTPFVTVKHLSNKQVLEIELPLPCKNTQKEIAQILEEAAIARQKRKAANALTNKFLQSTFLSMFGDPITNEKSWNKLNGIEYAEYITVGVVFKPASYYVNKGVTALRSLNIKPNKIVLENVVYFSEETSSKLLSKSILKTDDVVIVRTGQTGTAAVIPPELNGSNCIDLIIVRPNRKLIHPIFITYFFNSDFGKEVVLSKEVGGIQKHFNIGAIKSLKIPIPPIQLQQKFASIVAETEQLRQKQQQSEMELENLFQSLLQKYFS